MNGARLTRHGAGRPGPKHARIVRNHSEWGQFWGLWDLRCWEHTCARLLVDDRKGTHGAGRCMEVL